MTGKKTKNQERADKCICGKGQLEKLTETQWSDSINLWDPSDKIVFYKCNGKCGKIYKRNTEESRHNVGEIGSYSDYTEYDGDLTVKELRQIAPKSYGYLNPLLIPSHWDKMG